MKKIYLVILAMGTFGVVHAQDGNTTSPEVPQLPVELSQGEIDRDNTPSVFVDRGGSALWSEDFASGFNSDNGLWTVGGENGDVWKHATTIWTGCYTTGAQGSLDFTSQENGFMLFHADSVNCVDPDSDPPTIDMESLTGELISPSVDLSGVSAVSVSFEHSFRYCCSTMEVLLSVSNDGGETWTDFDVTANTSGNDYNTNTTHQINISEVAGDESDVTLKFTWNAGGTSSHYFWAIDDISLFVPEDYDLGMADATYSAFDPDESATYRDVAYSIYPISQIRDLTFSAYVTNYGGMAQNDVQLEVVVSDEGGSEIATLTSDEVALTPGQETVISIEGYIPPATVGDYTVSFELLSGAEDFNPEDNVVEDLMFSISESEYARDRGVSEGEFTNYDDDYKIGTTYYMETTETLYCIGVALSNTSTPGASYNLELLDAFDFAYLGETMFKSVPPVDALNGVGDSNWEWTWMSTPAVLTEGLDYAAVLNHFGGEDAVVLRLSGSSQPQTSFLYEGSEETWYYVTSTPMVRLGLSEDFCFDVVTAVEELDQITVNELYPNPTTGHTTLEFSMLETADVQIMLYDLQGRIVMQEDKGTQPVGEYRYDYDFSNLASGMYTLSIRVGDQSINKKLTVK